MKYLKTFEELSPEIYKNAAKGILYRDIEEPAITGRKVSKEAAEKAEKQAKELEDFAIERENKIKAEAESGSKSYSLLDFINSSKDPNTLKIWEPFWIAVASKQKTNSFNINSEWNEIIKMNSKQLINKLDVSMKDAKDIESFFKEKI